MSTLYQRRVEQEWHLLQLVAETNSALLQDIEHKSNHVCAMFSFTLNLTQALMGGPDHFRPLDSHKVQLTFTRFFPSTPIEASLAVPVFHPNVHPETGFVCLWNRFSPGDTVMEAISQLQQVITWKLVNQETDHLMQPEALAWYKDTARVIELPLACQPITKPSNFQKERTYAIRPQNSFRRRLE